MGVQAKVSLLFIIVESIKDVAALEMPQATQKRESKLYM